MRKGTLIKSLTIAALFIAGSIMLTGCGESVWNDPYPVSDAKSNILYYYFDKRPKHLDPVSSYVSNEYDIIAQIYEPPLQYHYLKRPYTLIPATATQLPTISYLDKQGNPLPAEAPDDAIGYSIYTIHIRPGIRYQPHPAFAKDAQGHYLYDHLSDEFLEHIYTLADFPISATRELTASDYVYQIKRLAAPNVYSPILGIMSGYIVGMTDYAKTLKQAWQSLKQQSPENKLPYLDLTQFPLAGVKLVDRYTYQIKVKGRYPQLRYWLAMPFFAPMPPEADRFYSQQGLKERNITLDWYPVGTGPYMLTVNNPNRQMVLERNPNFHDEFYPTEGEPGDAEKGLLKDAGKKLPFIDKEVFSLEKEDIPYWNKFLQGYYDLSAINSDSFDQAITMSGSGEASLTGEMKKKGIHLSTAVATSIYFTGFNMLDPLVGGYTARARKLRQAIAIAVDYEEYISIFLNGRGVSAQGPIPAGIFGHLDGKAGMNPYVYDWVNGRAQRKPLSVAKRLLAEAGYPNGRDAKTGEPLLINLDTAATGPDAKATLDWWRKQFKKLGIQLVIRATDFNRFQDKVLKGTAQFYQWGWNADYPDPENFMFLLYGPNGKVKYNGENGTNYQNPDFDRLFEKMKNMRNGPERQQIINRMNDIVRRDSPWLFGINPKGFSLYHQWYYNSKPNLIANNTLKYKRIDPVLRAKKRIEWNQPVVWPLYVMVLIIVLGVAPGVLTYIRKEHHSRHAITPVEDKH